MDGLCTASCNVQRGSPKARPSAHASPASASASASSAITAPLAAPDGAGGSGSASMASLKRGHCTIASAVALCPRSAASSSGVRSALFFSCFFPRGRAREPSRHGKTPAAAHQPRPSWGRTTGWAPKSSSFCTTAVCPLSAAQCSGVLPPSLTAFTAPWRMRVSRNSTISVCRRPPTHQSANDPARQCTTGWAAPAGEGRDRRRYRCGRWPPPCAARCCRGCLSRPGSVLARSTSGS